MHKNGRLEEERVTLIEACSPVKSIEPYYKYVEHPVTCLATMAYVYTQLRSTCYYFFSTGSKFWLVSNFTELHALTLATYTLSL